MANNMDQSQSEASLSALSCGNESVNPVKVKVNQQTPFEVKY
jgi:hypothetical protein